MLDTTSVLAAREKRVFFSRPAGQVASDLGQDLIGTIVCTIVTWPKSLLELSSPQDLYAAFEAALTDIRPHEDAGDGHLPPFQVSVGAKIRPITGGPFEGEKQRLAILYRGNWQNLTIKGEPIAHMVIAILDEQNLLVCTSHITLQKVKGGKFQTNLLRGPTGGEVAPMKLTNQKDLTAVLRKAHETGRLPNMQDWRTD